jgi:hypothetical protein
MMRAVLAAAIFIAAMSFDLRPASATEGRWCAMESIGKGEVHANCQFNTFEACRPTVLAGNRGFCNENPRYVGPAGPFKTHRRHAAERL